MPFRASAVFQPPIDDVDHRQVHCGMDTYAAQLLQLEPLEEFVELQIRAARVIGNVAEASAASDARQRLGMETNIIVMEETPMPVTSG